MWQILGMLSEYRGRFVLEEDGRVESFFCDETDAAEHFERLVERLPEDVDLRRSETPGSTCGAVIFRSARLAEQLNSFYDLEFTSGLRARDASGRYRSTARAHLERSTLAEGGEEAERAFLAGVLSRYRNGDEIVFANALPKVELTRELLLELGCADVPLVSRTDTIPNTHRLSLRNCSSLVSSSRLLGE